MTELCFCPPLFFLMLGSVLTIQKANMSCIFLSGYTHTRTQHRHMHAHITTRPCLYPFLPCVQLGLPPHAVLSLPPNIRRDFNKVCKERQRQRVEAMEQPSFHLKEYAKVSPASSPSCFSHAFFIKLLVRFVMFCAGMAQQPCLDDDPVLLDAPLG